MAVKLLYRMVFDCHTTLSFLYANTTGDRFTIFVNHRVATRPLSQIIIWCRRNKVQPGYICLNSNCSQKKINILLVFILGDIVIICYNTQDCIDVIEKDIWYKN